jgi:hypothetical protein
MKRFLLVTVLLIAPQSWAADMPPELQKTMACMTRALQSMPRIDDVKSGLEPVKKPTPGSEDVKMSVGVQQPDEQPYIEYRVHEADDATVLRFTGSRYAKTGGGGWGYSFQIGLSGIAAVGQEPRTYRTSEVVNAWKAQCGVDAIVLFV